jgi:hypothetical protein
VVSRPYRKIIAEYHRQYLHTVRLQNTGDWRFDYCSCAHYQATGGLLVWWHENGASLFGFKTADQAEAFQRWADTCGIDWTVEPNAQLLPHPPKPLERPSTYGPTRRA